MKRDVIVLSYNYSASLCAARSLGEAGYGVRLLALTDASVDIAGRSKYVKACVRTEIDFEDIYRGLEKLRGADERILIIPLHDKACMMLDENANRLKDHYYLPNINDTQGGISAFMDKMAQKQLARQCGLRTVDGRIMSTKVSEIDKTELASVQYPCFVKPLASSRCKAVKLIFARCNNADELTRALNNAYGFQCDLVLVEGFLDIEEELSAYGFAENGSVFLPARMDMLLNGYGRHKGVASEGMITSATKFGETQDKLIDFVERSGYSGLFCFDIILSKGEYYFSEINLRCGGSAYAVTKAGANLYAAYADMVYQYTMEGPKDIQRDVHFLSEMIELDALLDGYIKLREFKAHLSSNAARFIKSEDDPAPWQQFCRNGKKLYLIAFLRKIKSVMRRNLKKWR